MVTGEPFINPDEVVTIDSLIAEETEIITGSPLTSEDPLSMPAGPGGSPKKPAI